MIFVCLNLIINYYFMSSDYLIWCSQVRAFSLRTSNVCPSYTILSSPFLFTEILFFSYLIFSSRLFSFLLFSSLFFSSLLFSLIVFPLSCPSLYFIISSHLLSTPLYCVLWSALLYSNVSLLYCISTLLYCISGNSMMSFSRK